MGLMKIRLGDYIERYNEKCNIPHLSVWDVSGINREKEFFEPSKQVGSDTSNYKIVPPNYFACNLMHVGRDVVLPVALNRTSKNKYVSPAYTIFYLKNEDVILREYLFIFLNSSEKDRYFWFHCDSSVRDGMEWSAFCDIELEIPDKHIQEKYVDIYEGMLANLHSYEKGLEDLKLLCDGFIEDLRRNHPVEYIGPYIKFRNEKNSDEAIQLEQGINIQKEFISPQRGNSNLKGRKIVRTGDIAYCTQLNNENVAIAIREGPDCVVSSVYDVLYVTDNNKLNPKYLLLWLNRAEFGRYVYWKSTGTSYEFLDGQHIVDYKIPMPEKAVQDSIVKIFDIAKERKAFYQKSKNMIQSICPILIRGSIMEAKGGN